MDDLSIFIKSSNYSSLKDKAFKKEIYLSREIATVLAECSLIVLSL